MLGPVITGILGTRNSRPEYLTTVLYPMLISDSLAVGMYQIQGSGFWESPLEEASVAQYSVLAGTLIETIVYKTYNEPLAIDPLTAQFSVLAGTLIETIVYQNYNNGAVEPIAVANYSIMSGTLV